MPDLRALVVEDDADINQIVATHLARQGWQVTQAYSGSEARLVLGAGSADLRDSDTSFGSTFPGAGTPSSSGAAPWGGAAQAPTRIASQRGTAPLPFDVVICDLMLPGATGEELIAAIRERDAQMPVIVISARSAISDRVDLLKLGADDYLVKPFDLDELSARIEVQLRHRAARSHTAGVPTSSAGVEGAGSTGSSAARVLRFRAWQLDPEERTFCVDGAAIELTRIEFSLLEIMMRQPRRVFTKQELFEQAWGEPYAADDNTLNVHISHIRAKLRPSGTDDYLKTVWGMGFKLNEG